MKVTRLFQERHRGFQIGYTMGRHGYLAAWRSSLESEWTIGHIYVDMLNDVAQLARECIDFQYRKEVVELELGRKPTIEELPREDLSVHLWPSRLISIAMGNNSMSDREREHLESCECCQGWLAEYRKHA